MAYKVTAPLVLAVDAQGHTHHVYQGGLIEWLSDEQREHFLSEGLVEELGDAEFADVPDESWTRAAIDDWAAEHGIDTTHAGNKAEALALIDEKEG